MEIPIFCSNGRHMKSSVSRTTWMRLSQARTWKQTRLPSSWRTLFVMEQYSVPADFVNPQVMSISIFRCGNYCWDVNISILKNRGWMNIPCNGKSLRILRRVKKCRTNEYNKVLDISANQWVTIGKKENGESFSTFSVSVPRPVFEICNNDIL